MGGKLCLPTVTLATRQWPEFFIIKTLAPHARVISNFGDVYYTQVPCPHKTLPPVVYHKQVTHSDNSYYLNSSSTLKCSRMTGERKAEGRNRGGGKQWRKNQSYGWLWHQLWSHCQGPTLSTLHYFQDHESFQQILAWDTTDGLVLRAGTLGNSEHIAFRWPWESLIFTLDLRQGRTNKSGGVPPCSKSVVWIVGCHMTRRSQRQLRPPWLAPWWKFTEYFQISRQLSRPPRSNCYIFPTTACHTAKTGSFGRHRTSPSWPVQHALSLRKAVLFQVVRKLRWPLWNILVTFVSKNTCHQLKCLSHVRLSQKHKSLSI